MPFNPQPGDCVTIRTWDDMAEEYGLNIDGEIKTPHIILKSVKQFCGHSYIVEIAFNTSKPDRWSYFFTIALIASLSVLLPVILPPRSPFHLLPSLLIPSSSFSLPPERTNHETIFPN